MRISPNGNTTHPPSRFPATAGPLGVRLPPPVFRPGAVSPASAQVFRPQIARTQPLQAKNPAVNPGRIPPRMDTLPPRPPIFPPHATRPLGAILPPPVFRPGAVSAGTAQPSRPQFTRVTRHWPLPVVPLKQRSLPAPRTIQRITQAAFAGLYDTYQSEYPALRFHKNTQWREVLKTEGKFRGDAYALRDPRFDPVLSLGFQMSQSRLKAYQEEWVKSGKPEKYSQRYGSLAGYNSALRATVERSVHRTITEKVSEAKTVQEALDLIEQAGPLLIVDAREAAAYERYYSPDNDQFSFGKVGKRDFSGQDVLQDIPLITQAVRQRLSSIKDQKAGNSTIDAIRSAIIDTALSSVDHFLENRYKPRILQTSITSVSTPKQSTQQRSYAVPLDWDENAPEVLSLLEGLEDDMDASYLDEL